MSRIDQHIGHVRNKLALGLFLDAWAWAWLLLAGIVWLVVIGEHLLDRWLSHAGEIFWIGVAVTAVAASVYGMIRRPSRTAAAVAIDNELGLKEKFSTALSIPTAHDPFEQAVLLDANMTAQNVSLRGRFPLKFPQQIIGAAVVMLGALMTAMWLPTFNWLPKPAPLAQKAPTTMPSVVADKFTKQELPKIEVATQLLSNNDAIKKANDELKTAIQTKEGDELRAKRGVLSALQDYNKAILDELNKNEQYLTVQTEQQQLGGISAAKDDSTPVGKAQNEIKNGDLDSAMNDLAKAVDAFDKSAPQEQQKMLDQAQQLAQSLKQAANNPQTQQKMQQQLQQMGATQQQAQQMAKAMQQAANGNQQSQQQLQQMAQKMAQQMNNGQGPTQQQRQQMQALMNKAQAQANSQATAQALAGSAQQLAQAMNQASQARQQQQQQQQHGQTPGNQSSSQNQQQAMSQANQNMQQQLQQMQVMSKDAQAMKAAADAAGQAAADAAGAMDGSGGAGQGAGGQQGNAPGQNNAGQGGQANGQQGGAGGNGGRGPGGGKMGIAEVPAHFKQEMDPSKDNPNGKMLASRLVKAGIDPGKSTAGAQNVSPSAQQDSADEIDQDHIPREAQQAEKDYFTALQKAEEQ